MANYTYMSLRGPKKDGSVGMSGGKKNWSEFLCLDTAFQGKSVSGAEGNWEFNYMVKGLVHENDEIENNKDLFPKESQDSDGVIKNNPEEKYLSTGQKIQHLLL